MSVESEILRIQRNIADTYAAVASKGGDVPLQPNSENLAAAVASIPAGDAAYLVKAPIGTIVIWSGTTDNIPAGWQLCDGTNGTPDLRDKFVLGAGESHVVGDEGGSEEVTLTVDQMPSHTHVYTIRGINSQASQSGNGANSIVAGTTTNTQPSGGSQPHSNMPPYYTLCYIMKIAADPAADGVTMDQVNAAIQEAINAAMSQTNIPAGGIIVWSGSTVPDGWALCNGENGTPDLRGRFILGASDDYTMGSTGGEEEVALTVAQLPNHAHVLKTGPGTGTSYGNYVEATIANGKIVRNDAFVGNGQWDGLRGDAHNNMPPYYALAYIMKL